MTAPPPPPHRDPSLLVEVIDGRGPLLLSVPHSGRAYSPSLLAQARLGRGSLEPLEDPFVDRLVQGVIDRGTGAIIARAPRALIDVNRSEDELDPRAIAGGRGEPPTARARAGLGLIPTRLAGTGDLWRAPLPPAELEQRLDAVHRPYHRALAARLATLRAGHNEVLLLDCHSMPPRPPGEADVVIGDRHGAAAAPWLVEAAEAIARGRGFAVARNVPFAGGHVLERHAAPARGIHAIQIEIDRAAYCTRDGRTPGPGFDRVALLFEALAHGLAAMLDRPARDAAE